MMKHVNLEDMFRGWFIGDFEPNIYRTDAFEVAIQKYKEGDREARHVHKVATEITALVSGSAIMCGREWHAGSIIRIEPGDSTDFHALTDVVAVVVKFPSLPSDKYLI